MTYNEYTKNKYTILFHRELYILILNKFRIKNSL